ncbi:histidine--tRNA ligase [Collinsella sp. AGMB00827]|uniref:Histidine--tRNA ligase n=1 Tax=Collinsella ureilytica TaxID=2869515 RepID=A0ABS7MK39_9ACTN|nr:histidine--tRNA ligase [Collinsella urealyticum]MBY4797455.1 histidine--tRNA ligase [Collinsella urealyticum]
MRAQKAEGTRDLIGDEMRAWTRMQEAAAAVFHPYGFDEVETPAIEQLDVFVHGIGESTDVVRKEMFRVFSGANYERVLAEGSDASLKPKQRLALRPEGTAGVVRSVVENNLVPQGAAPLKVYYAEPMFRGERPQRGRLRQFHQIGLEWIGAPDPAADAECIIMLMDFYRELGFDLSKLRLLINSMGDPACRPAYRESVRSFIFDHADEMCDECLVRAKINPLRAFDCKNEHCREVMQAAPLVTESLCEDCASHYAEVKAYLDRAGIAYIEDPRLVRGLDYYTRTVFEVEVPGAGVGSIGGGGRYDGLVEIEGGRPTPGVGFAVGFERALLALEAMGVSMVSPADELGVYVAATGADMRTHAFDVCLDLRRAGIRTEADYQSRSLKGQFKQADKLGVRFAVIVGEEELAAGSVKVRNLTTRTEELVAREEIAAYLLAQV